MKKSFIPNFPTTVVLFLYLFFLFLLHVYGIQRLTLDLKTTVIVLAGLGSVFLLFKLIGELTAKNRFLFVFVNILFLVLYLQAGIYHFRIKGCFDYSLFIDNIAELFYVESSLTVLGTFHPSDHFISLLMIVALILLELKYRLLSRACKQQGRTLMVGVWAILYLAITLFPYPLYDELGQLAQSAWRYYHPKIVKNDLYHQLNAQEFPYLATQVSDGISYKKKRPHIFLVAMESFSASFIEKKNEQGQEYTPVFNSLIPQGVYYQNFWGNSIQTAKGHFAMLCSLLPLTRGKFFTDYAEKTDFNCLPEILRQVGYETIFFQGNKNLEFDNTHFFMKKNGFVHIKNPDLTRYSEEELKRYMWGWGIQDDLFFAQAFEFLDELKEKTDRPLFTMLATISNHMRFNYVPKDLRQLDEQDPYKGLFVNSLHAADEFLATFFAELKKRDYLKNSIVILVGDHSFPAGEHGIYHNETGFYNEIFKIPLLVIWDGVLKPKRITKGAFSQIDIAPTILDLLDIEQRKNHFTGRSVFDGTDHLVHTIQPYGGLYLSVIDYPYKYVLHKKSEDEYLFDLQTDPMEQLNLVKQEEYLDIVKSLQREVSRFYLNDHLIRSNRIWSLEQ